MSPPPTGVASTKSPPATLTVASGTDARDDVVQQAATRALDQLQRVSEAVRSAVVGVGYVEVPRPDGQRILRTQQPHVVTAVWGRHLQQICKVAAIESYDEVVAV